MNKGQQEIIGFVLIVALVIVAGMIFLIISLKQPVAERQSIQAENMLNAITSYTTECAITFEPQYDTIEDLIKSCYEKDACSNIEKDACEYLNETLWQVMKDALETESEISSYTIDISQINEGVVTENLIKLSQGNCTGAIYGAKKSISSSSGSLSMTLKICS